MGGGGRNPGRWRPVYTAAVAITLGFGVLAGAACLAEEPADGKRLLLLYGTRRVEYVPDCRESKTGQDVPGNRLVLIGGEQLTHPGADAPAAGASSPAGATPVMPLPPVATARHPVESPKTFRSPLPGDPQPVHLPPVLPEANPLRYLPVESPLVYSGSGQASPVVPQNGSAPGTGSPPWQDPPEAPRDPHSNGPQRGRFQANSPDSSEEFSDPSLRAAQGSPRRDWLLAGAAQAAGTLVGLLLGGLVCLVVYLLIRDRSEVKFEPTIRLELPPLAVTAGSSPSDAVAGGRADPHLRVVDAPHAGRTPVADFRDDVIPFDLSAMASRQRAEEAAETRERQEKLLRQVYEDNLALRDAMAARTMKSE